MFKTMMLRFKIRLFFEESGYHLKKTSIRKVNVLAQSLLSCDSVALSGVSLWQIAASTVMVEAVKLWSMRIGSGDYAK